MNKRYYSGMGTLAKVHEQIPAGSIFASREWLHWQGYSQPSQGWLSSNEPTKIMVKEEEVHG